MVRKYPGEMIRISTQELAPRAWNVRPGTVKSPLFPQFCSVVRQKRFVQLHELIRFGDPTLADGILDRLVHNAHRIEMGGNSIRKLKGVKEEK